MALFGLRPAEVAFEGGSLETSAGTLKFEVEHIGELVLRGEGGFFRRLFGMTQLVASDPWVAGLHREPFADLVPAGKHPVSVAYAALPTGGYCIAYLRVQFTTRKIVGWRHAVTAADADELRCGGRVGYGVDSGFGCLMGLQAARHLKRRVSDETDGLEKEVLDSMAPTETEGGAHWARIEVAPECAENVVIVKSGLGDGQYGSYFGIDDRDLIACLVTDFDVAARLPRPGADVLKRLMKWAPALRALQQAREQASGGTKKSED